MCGLTKSIVSVPALAQQLERCNDSQLVKSRNVFGPDQLQVSNGMWQARISISFSGSFDAIQRLGDCLVADRMNVNNHALLVSCDRKFGELGRTEEELAVFPAVPIRRGKHRRLRRVFQHAVGKHLDPDDLHIRKSWSVSTPGFKRSRG
jgi:hypothetical protein